MKVLFDHQIFDIQRYGGISRYFYELMAGLESHGNIEYDLSTLYSTNEYLKNGSLPISARLLPVDERDHLKEFLFGFQFKGKGRVFNWKNRIFPKSKPLNYNEANKKNSIAKLKEGNFDVFHPTYYDDYFLEYIGNKPYVLTVYDLIHQIFPEYFLNDGFVDKNLDLLKKASRIVAISESTKKDLINLFGIEEQKIMVTHLANSLSPDSSKVATSFTDRVPDEFILFTGHRFHYKNFLFFIQVIKTVITEYPDLKIVCTGYTFTSEELKFFKKLNLSDRIIHFYVSDSELTYLYQHARAFIFPSLYEGFGLPVLEAFSCGCPVVCSRSSSLLEIGGDATLYFEPKDALSMARTIRTVLDDEPLRQQMIERGYKQLDNFSWSKTAALTSEIYKHI